MKNDRADIQAIKERIDIVTVISRYLSLTKSGETFKGRCPFHKDDTPSFVVSPQKGLWHCFGCGEGGDLFGFLMKIERITFPEAAKRLASEAGLSLKQQPDGQRERLRRINAEAAAYFCHNLAEHASGKKAREYLLGRGYQEESWRQFGLGYAVPGWDHLKAKFAERFGIKSLIDLGLLVQGKEGAYDRFRDRVIFPIHDLSGRTIAFGGRALQGEPKYLNSPKTDLFDKGRHLYGLFWAREALATRRCAILVEGYTDVLSLRCAGIPHVVGSMGTALTQSQADLLRRFVEEVVIVYDCDAAGGAASLRGMSILHNSGLFVRVARLPEGDDPDSLVRRDGAERMLELSETALPFHSFYVETISTQHDLQTFRGKEQALEEARSFYSQLSSIPLRDAIVVSLAETLKMGESDVKRFLRGKQPHYSAADEGSNLELGTPEDVVLALLLQGRASWEQVAKLALPEDFSPVYHPIVEAIAEENGPCDLSQLVQHLDEESARLASYLALAPVTFSNAEKALHDALTKLVKLPAIERKLAEMRKEIVEIEKTGDRNRVDALQRAYSTLVSQKLSRRGKYGER